MELILHIVNIQDWESNIKDGYYYPSSLRSVGFIHCSTITQTADTANQFFNGKKGLVLLCIDKSQLEPEVRYENPAGEGDQRIDLLFPHVYGPLNISSVIKIIDFVPDENGKFELPLGI